MACRPAAPARAALRPALVAALLLCCVRAAASGDAARATAAAHLPADNVLNTPAGLAASSGGVASAAMRDLLSAPLASPPPPVRARAPLRLPGRLLLAMRLEGHPAWWFPLLYMHASS